MCIGGGCRTLSEASSQERHNGILLFAFSYGRRYELDSDSLPFRSPKFLSR